MCDNQSNFKSDLKGEEVVGTFLQRFFYDKLEIINFAKSIPGEEDFKNKQYRGIDLEFMFNNKNYVIDEKATLCYPNPILTFAFELKYRKSGEWKNGWIYDVNKYTEYYLLV